MLKYIDFAGMSTVKNVSKTVKAGWSPTFFSEENFPHLQYIKCCRDKNIIIIIIPSLTVPLAVLPRAVSSCRVLRGRISIQNQERLYNDHAHDDDGGGDDGTKNQEVLYNRHDDDYLEDFDYMNMMLLLITVMLILLFFPLIIANRSRRS